MRYSMMRAKGEFAQGPGAIHQNSGGAGRFLREDGISVTYLQEREALTF